MSIIIWAMPGDDYHIARRVGAAFERLLVCKALSKSRRLIILVGDDICDTAFIKRNMLMRVRHGKEIAKFSDIDGRRSVVAFVACRGRALSVGWKAQIASAGGVASSPRHEYRRPGRSAPHVNCIIGEHQKSLKCFGRRAKFCQSNAMKPISAKQVDFSPVMIIIRL